jgi:hypothetical protein
MQRKLSTSIKSARRVSVADQDKKDMYPFSFMALVFLAGVMISSIAKKYTTGNAPWGAGACAIAMMIAAKTRWDLKTKWWFWIALCLGGALQLPFGLLLPWSDRYLSGTGALAFVIPGFLLAYGCIFLAEKLFESSARSK